MVDCFRSINDDLDTFEATCGTEGKVFTDCQKVCCCVYCRNCVHLLIWSCIRRWLCEGKPGFLDLVSVVFDEWNEEQAYCNVYEST